MENNKKIFSSIQAHFINFLIALPLFLLLALDSFGNSETVFKLIGVQSYQLVIPSLLLFLFVRWKRESFIHRKVNSLFRFTLIIGLITTTLLTVYDALTPANAAFALTRLHQDHLWLLTITAGIIFVLNKTNAWWHEYWKQALFLTPFIFYYIAVITRLFPFDVFLQLVKEDHFIEYSQFWVLGFGSVSSFFIAHKLKKKSELLFMALFVFFGLGFFFVAGDEISWGQRILAIEVNESVKQINRQDELTIHNLYAVEWLVIYGYVVLSTFGVFSRFICEKISFLNRYLVFTPKYQLLGYFLFPFIFYFMQLKVEGGIWQPWSEVAELYFYSGLVLWIFMFGQSLLIIPSKLTWRKLLTES